MLDWLNFYRSVDVGIDLGTASVLIYCKGKGIVLREPAVAAVDRNTGQIKGVGIEAQRMLGRTPGNIEAVRPLKNGVISDDAITLKMLQMFILKWRKRKSLKNARVMVCVPSGITDVEQRAVKKVAYDLGAKEVFVLEEPRAAAIGAGLDISQPRGCMVVDIGGGTTDIAVISMGQCVVSASLKVAGDKMDDAVVRYIKKKHNLLIGERTAELIKINIGTAFPRSETLYTEVNGRNLLTGLPKTITVSSEEIRQALSENINSLMQGVHSVLEKTHPELAADIYVNGICMTGGGSLLFGLDKLFSETFRVNCYIADDPLSCVALGAGVCLDQLSSSDDPYLDDIVR